MKRTRHTPEREPRARDFAGRDFKRYLKIDRGWAPSSVNLALAATDALQPLPRPGARRRYA
jgi:hypothetical protein